MLNATIDKHAYATIKPRSDRQVVFRAADLEQVESYHSDDPILVEPGPLGLHKAVYRKVVKEFVQGRPLPLELITYSDAPPGSGLGSSSTLVVAMLKAFTEWLNLPLGEYDIAKLAFVIERRELGQKGGRQDQYAATFGGCNFMEFYANERVIVNPLRIKNWILAEFEASLILYFTGTSRDSERIINDQMSRMSQKDRHSLDSLHSMKTDALKFKEYLLKGDISALSKVLDTSWAAKKRTADGISNPRIDKAYEDAKSAGALAGKVSGAGGGGFMMFVVDPVNRMDVIRVLEKNGGFVLPCHFTKTGTEGWKLW